MSDNLEAMPASEVYIEKYYSNMNGDVITIQAGKHEWAIIYNGKTVMKKNTVRASAKDNFQEAIWMMNRKYPFVCCGCGSLTIKEDFDGDILNEIPLRKGL